MRADADLSPHGIAHLQAEFKEDISKKRNMLAHGEAITKEITTALRECIISDLSHPGMLCCLAEHIEVKLP